MLILGAEFIAMLLIIVYVGAVAVLFLFVVMMLNIDFAELRSGLSRYLPLGTVIAIVLLAEILIAFSLSKVGAVKLAGLAAPTPANVPNIQAMGTLLYSR